MTVSNSAVKVEGLWKNYRLYHEKNQYLKSTLLKGRRARYETFWALSDVSFDVHTGTTFGIIGNNGSGKSTILKCLAQVLTPDKGSLQINGRASALLELGAGFHPDLSGVENIYLNGAILGMSHKQIGKRLDDIVDFSGLGNFIDTPVKDYSSGMTVRLGFAIAINVDPEILIIDEVLAVGDTAFQQKCRDKINEFRNDGRTIILVSHGLGDVKDLCQSVLWLDKGQVRKIGSADEVISEYVSANQVAPTLSHVDSYRRWGSMDCSIDQVQLLNDDGSPLSHIRTGSAIRFRIYIKESPESVLPTASISLSLGKNNDVLTSSSTDIVNVNNQTREIKYFEARIPNFPLNTGEYLLSVVLRDHSNAQVLDYWDKAIRVPVISDQGQGLVATQTEWIIG